MGSVGTRQRGRRRNEEWFDNVTTKSTEGVTINRRFDNVCGYQVMNHVNILEHDKDEIFHDDHLLLQANEGATVPNKTDYESVLQMLGWQPLEIVKRTFKITTQCVKISISNQPLTKSQVVDSYRIKFFNKGFVNNLEDNICERGAMYKLISDNFRPEVKREVEDIIDSLSIQRWTQKEMMHLGQ